jgi:hypothetical protein
LNVWPLRTTSDPGAVLVEPAVWAARFAQVDTGASAVFVAVDDHYGRGAAVAAVARAQDGRFELDGWLVDDWAAAFADVELLAGVRDRVELVVASSLVDQVEPRYRPKVMAPADTRAGLALLRQLISTGQVCHDRAPELEVLTAVHVRETPTGLTLVPGVRADLVRASAWALLAAHRAPPIPAIH